MDLSSFKLDIDELIHEFSEGNSTTLSDMKRIWMSRKFSYIYEARPTTNVAFFMQALYAHSIGHMLCTDSFSQRLGGLYCLYCLYETQPFKPPFRIYLSLGELRKLKHLVIEAKNEDIKVLPALVGKMLEKNMFLFGFVDINEGSVTERVNEITSLQIGRTQLAYEKLLANTPIEHCLHMDLDMELDQKVLKKMSTEYATAKELAIKEAGKVVDIENIKHIAENKTLIGDAMEKITEDWNVQKEVFYEQTGFNRRSLQGEKQVTFYQQTGTNQVNYDDGEEEEEEQVNEDYSSRLEHLLLEVSQETQAPKGHCNGFNM